MPFDIAGREQKKQRLNLSDLAWDVVQNDMLAFQAKHLSTFLNRVFENYSPEAEASIARTLARRKEALAQQLEQLQENEETKERIIQLLKEQEGARLVEKTRSYEKSNQLNFSLNNQNLNDLTGPDCHEELYYHGYGRGKYLKSVVEEYARLPYVERERVYFSGSIHTIESAISMKDSLAVTAVGGMRFAVRPYKICRDPLATANYLVGYSMRCDHPEDSWRPCSFRISALGSVRQRKSESGFLKKEQCRELEQLLNSRGVQFMLDGEEEVQVRLTKAGKEKYLRQIHLRPVLKEPTHISEAVDDYKFLCTARQAEYYFFKFGEDVEILQPESLREKFRSMYAKALSIYQ